MAVGYETTGPPGKGARRFFRYLALRRVGEGLAGAEGEGGRQHPAVGAALARYSDMFSCALWSFLARVQREWAGTKITFPLVGGGVAVAGAVGGAGAAAGGLGAG